VFGDGDGPLVGMLAAEAGVVLGTACHRRDCQRRRRVTPDVERDVLTVKGDLPKKISLSMTQTRACLLYGVDRGSQARGRSGFAAPSEAGCTQLRRNRVAELNSSLNATLFPLCEEVLASSLADG
jgi:hypothetical protein